MVKLPGLAALLLAVGIVAAACGGGGGNGGLSVEEYFSRLQAISDRVNAQFDASEQELDEAFGGVEDASQVDERLLNLFKDFFDTNVQAITDAREEVDDLDPPDEIQEAHDQFRGALADFAAALSRLADAIQDVDEPLDLEQWVAEQEPELQTIQERFSAACAAFEDVARDHDINLSLECDE